LFEVGTAARAGLARGRLQRKQLTNVGQQHRRRDSVCFTGWGHVQGV
jgi:hypothetical protein